MDNLEQLQLFQKIESLFNEVNERSKEIEKHAKVNPGDPFPKDEAHQIIAVLSNIQGQLHLLHGSIKRGE